MPIPVAELGPDAAGIPLAQDSGVVSNAAAAQNASGNVTAAELAGLGRTSGYELDYMYPVGLELFGLQGLGGAETGVELYQSPADALNGLAFWKKNASGISHGLGTGFHATVRPLAVSGLAMPDFGASLRLAVPDGLRPIYGVEISFASGDLVAEVQLLGSSATGLPQLAETLAKRLAQRMNAVEAGQIPGPPVALPRTGKGGPVPGGPDLETLALGAARLGGGTVTKQGYTTDTTFDPVSEYERDFTPAGVFVSVEDKVLRAASPQEASLDINAFTRILGSPKLLETFGGATGSSSDLASYNPSFLHLHVGDQSAAVEARLRLKTGAMLDEGTVLFRVGSTFELIIVVTPPDPSLPAKLDQLAAIAAGLAEHKPVGTMTTATSLPAGNLAARSAVLRAERKTGTAGSLMFTMNMKFDFSGVKESIAANGVELLRLHQASLAMSISVLGLAAQKVETLQIGTKAYVSLSALSTPAAEARGIKPWIVENLKSSLGYDPWSLTSLKSLTAIRDVEPAGSGTDNGVAVRRYTATVDLATALALNAQLGVALKKFGSALSLLPAVITVHLDLGNDGYVHRLAESFTLPSTQPVSLSLVMTMNGYNTQTGTLVAPPASDVMTLQQFKQLTGSSGLPYTA